MLVVPKLTLCVVLLNKILFFILWITLYVYLKTKKTFAEEKDYLVQGKDNFYWRNLI